MKKFIHLLLILMCSFCAKTTIAQDIHFTEIYMAPMVLNPANAGAFYKQRAILMYRSQWRSVTTPFVSIKAAYDMNFKNPQNKKGYWAGGVFVYNDKAGDSQMSLTQVNFSGAYHLPIDAENIIGAGIQGGYFQRSANTSSLSWGNQFDGYQYNPSLSPNENFGDGTMAFGKLDAAIGVVHTYHKSEMYKAVVQRITSGIAVHHLNKPEIDYVNVTKDRLYYRWVIHSEAEININEKIKALPTLAYYYQGKLKEFIIGSNFMYAFQKASTKTTGVKSISAGLGAMYRWKDAAAVTFLLNYDKYLFGMSYDFNISSLKQASNYKGAFEISLRYLFESEKIRSKSRFR
jgi:type IX secretion system PorP/SprF family membrane protein